MIQTISCCIIGYFFGSLRPSAYVSKKQKDLTTTGTGNLGSTNTMLAYGLRCGIFVLVFDLLKAFTAVRLAVHLFPIVAHNGYITCFSAVTGHIFPFQIKLKGGKGSACFAGVVLANQSLLFPFMAAYRTKSLTVFYIPLSMGMLIIYKHRENFLAVKDGTEGRFRTYFCEKLRRKI